ncbi:transporter [Geovibrio thiophilus]|uniref:Transporter n=1 Tax=Geovibrio thiophilus TaxID=139438 RepID=A0A410K0N6_9BACT|nr:transporter [Geovibrio thiophilus]QAR33895.1 transporter [Geovibrio thiophilus]
MLKKLTFIVLLLTFTGLSHAQDYSLGSEGIKAGTAPGPGFYYLMYNNYYTSDKSMDKDGDENDIGFDLSTFANVHRFVYVTDKKILGAYYGMNIIIPLVYADLSIDAAGVDKDDTAVGDIVVEPMFLSWRKERYEAVLGTALIVPTGSYDKDHALNIGKDHYTFMLTLGGTYYPEPDREWSLSVLTRYEKHFENQDTDVTYGDDIDFEWGVAKAVTKKIEVGLVGYAHWQITDDKGSDVTWERSTHDRVYGIGPEVDIFSETLGAVFKCKLYKEFEARDTNEGTSAWLTIVKPL